MPFKIHVFRLKVKNFGFKEGALLESPEGTWGEVSPLPGRNRETLAEAIDQLKSLQQGYKGPFFPSVSCGLFGLKSQRLLHAPVCLFLMGSLDEIYHLTKQHFGCTTAKIKLAPFDLPTSIDLVKTLKAQFRLRIDLGAKWSREKLFKFLSHFSPQDFDFIEDPGYDISPFPMACDDYSLGTFCVWKPMVKGLPPPHSPLILSSTYESGIGLHQIAAMTKSFSIPSHPLGIGTFLNLENDLLKDPLYIHKGEVIFPEKILINRKLLSEIS